MKIAFVLGSLEPGNDGVADYTYLLAQELTRLGHECRLVAVHDRVVSQIETAIPGDGTAISKKAEAAHGTPAVPQLRLPGTIPWSQRIDQAREYLDAFAPDWVSVQFVPYSFENRGLIYGLSKQLRPLLRGRQFHLMFHETWIGEGDWSFKDKFIGRIQRRLVVQFVRSLHPAIIHATNAIFLEQLKRLGIKAKLLRLFGNIPVTTKSGDDWLLPQLQAAGLPISANERDQWWIFGFFGSVYQAWPAEPLMGFIKTAAAKRGKRVAVLSAGHLGDENVWSQLAQNHPEFSFAALGRLPGERISEYFNSLDYGIAASAYAFIGKSGSAAAMLEHGLPLIVNRDDWKAPGGLSEQTEREHQRLEERTPNLIKMGDDFAALLEGGLPRIPACSFLREVAEQMLADMRAST